MNLTSSENAWVKVISLASEITVLPRLCCSSCCQCCFIGSAVSRPPISGRAVAEGVCVVSTTICSSGCQCCFSGHAVSQTLGVVLVQCCDSGGQFSFSTFAVSRSRFIPKLVHVTFLVGKVALRQILLQYSTFSLQLVFHMLRTCRLSASGALRPLDISRGKMCPHNPL